MPTQAERRAQTQSAIIEAAFAALAQHPSKEVSLDAIAELAGVTKGSIHYHFGNRVGLLKAVAVWLFEKMEAEVARQTPKRGQKNEGPAVHYARTLLTAQATRTGRVLFTLGDELARVSELDAIDPYAYLCHRLEGLGVKGSVSAVAGTIMQFGRQLAYGLTPTSEIENMVNALTRGGHLESGSTQRDAPKSNRGV